jgi:hypothetical protein
MYDLSTNDNTLLSLVSHGSSGQGATGDMMDNSPFRHSRGITESDVWKAADALLLEGARPTIERVRLKIGRGSPNTVSPHLETWFRHLGGRIQDPGAFSAPPEVPDSVAQAARHFWETASAAARAEHAEQLATATQAMRSEMAIHQQEMLDAQGALRASEQRCQELATELNAARRAVEQLQQAQASDAVRLEELRRQLGAAAERLTAQEAAISVERQQMHASIAESHERVTAAEQRAALDMDRERQARARADKRAEAAELALQVQRRDAQLQQARDVERSAHLKAALDQQQRLNDQRQQQIDLQGSQLTLLRQEADTAQRLHQQTLAELARSRAALAELSLPSPAARHRAARRLARQAEKKE